MSEESDTTQEISERPEEVEALRSELETLQDRLREARDERNLSQKEASKETSEVFKLLATLSTGTAITMSVITSSLLPDADEVAKLGVAYGLMLASLVGSLLTFLVLTLNVVDRILPETGELPVAKTRWFKYSFATLFVLALFGFLGGIFFFVLFVQENM
ncbi:MAG: hypothetical protein M3R38_23115 [Actinomycetota bacterium]|nr:hypothetical protein [Actinomycetota bacterium]